MKILFIGDIVGKPGRRAVAHFIPQIKKEEGVDFVIANGENLAAGKGMTFEKYDEMIKAGVNYFTSGNHIWNNADFIPCLNDAKIKVLRPANYPVSSPGRGSTSVEIKGVNLAIINLQGRVFMKDDIESPFIIGKNIVEDYPDSLIIIDFHAEATSEKMAFGYYLDGHVSAILGTHTHVQTADEKILPNGTAFISDIGMCGPENSVLGVKKEIIIEKFLTQLPQSHKIASGDSIFNAVVVEIDKNTKKAKKIKRIREILKSE
ncbi:MAG: TIGR00282 family metallophosphoesterase [Patescibacteria group bacterium]|nr:TIGR00282 family metallophosphoesterase [Patescibacteria group bacterium]